jgi:hypothetical protein
MATQSTGVGHGTTQVDPLSSLQQSSGIPVEMSEIEASKRTGAGSQGLLNDVSIPTASHLGSTFHSTTSESGVASENTNPAPTINPTSSAAEASKDPPLLTGKQQATPVSTTPATSSAPASPPVITRLDSIAIGPDAMLTPVVANEAGPVLVITLLLTSGARHPYKIDEKYLTKRNVNVPGTTSAGKKDPFSISVYTLKELILREWREEWEAQPSSPSSIRLIYFGRLLDDKTALKGMFHLLKMTACVMLLLTKSWLTIVMQNASSTPKQQTLCT